MNGNITRNQPDPESIRDRLFHSLDCALTKNKKFGFLRNFNIPETKIAKPNNKQNDGWIYLCNYKNNISNIKMDINLFYKFIKNKPENFFWYSIDRPCSEFIPSFTKKIFKKVICPGNKRYVPALKKCVIKTSREKMKKRRAIKRGAIKKKGRMGRILRRRLKSLKKRKAFGLKRGR